MIRDAVFDATGAYRYRLDRSWSARGPGLCWVLLNPSTADASSDDPTIRRVMSFSRSWGYSAARVVNLFAWRTTRPKGLRTVDDPVGPENDTTILETADRSDRIVVAWGNNGSLANPQSGRPRHQEVLDMLGPHLNKVASLGLTARSHPAHPLYLAGTTSLTRLNRR